MVTKSLWIILFAEVLLTSPLKSYKCLPMSAGVIKRLKQMIILFWVIFLLVDLADDGCFGKAQPTAPLSRGTISQFFSIGSSSNADSTVWNQLPKMLSILNRWQYQSILVESDDHFTVIKSYLLTSSGGIPL